MSNIEILDKDLPINSKTCENPDIMNQFHIELDNFEEELKKDPNIKSEQFEQILYAWLVWLLDDVDDKKTFDIILKKLESKSEKITIEDIDTLRVVLGSLEDKEISKSDLNELAEAIDAIRVERKWLRSLEWEALRTRNQIILEKQALEKAKKKLAGYTDKLKKFKTQHPIWTKALISLLPATITAKLFSKAKEYDENDMFGFSKIIEQVKSALANIAIPFFSWFAPKEMRDFLVDIKKDSSFLLQMVETDWLPEIKKFANEISGNLWHVWENISELTSNKVDRLKDGLHGYFLHYIRENMNPKLQDKDFDNFFSEWFTKLKNRGVSIKGDFEDFIENIQKWDANIDMVFSALWLGIASASDFVYLAVKKWIIDAKYIWLNILEKGWEIVFESIMFFPKMTNIVLWKGSLEDFYTSLKKIWPDSMSEDYKNMILANIYRLLNFTTTGSILKNISAIPFYALSAVSGQLSEWISKSRIALDSLMWKTNSKLKVLADIEELLWKWENRIYKDVLTATKKYEKASIVSAALSTSKWNYDKFSQILKKADLEDLLNTEFRNLTSDNFSKKAWQYISSYLEKTVVDIKAPLWQVKDLVESVKIWSTWIFSKTKLLQDASKIYSEALLSNAKMLQNDKIFKFYQKYPNLFKKTIAESKITNVLDLASIQGEIKDIWWFFNELKVLVKSFPEFAKFIFGHAPILILGWIHMKEIFKDLEKGELSKTGKEITTFLAELTPVIWPLTLTYDELKQWHLMAGGANALWVGIDTYILINISRATQESILKTWAKMTYRPILDTAKFSLQSIKAIGKIWKDMVQVGKNWFKKEALKVFWQNLKAKSGKIAFGIWLIVALWYTAKEIIHEMKLWRINDKIMTFAKIAREKWGVGVMENYINENFESFDKDTKEGLLMYVFNTYLWDPIINPIIKELNIDDKNKILSVIDFEKTADPIFIENLNRFVGIANKLWYKFQMTGVDGNPIYIG